VTTAAASAVAGALRTRELARELDAGVAAVVLNRCGSAPPHGTVRAALGAPVTAIPDDGAVAATRETGRPVTRGHPAFERFEELAGRVATAHSGRS
jgi:septum site-determining protein MinD